MPNVFLSGDVAQPDEFWTGDVAHAMRDGHCMQFRTKLFEDQKFVDEAEHHMARRDMKLEQGPCKETGPAAYTKTFHHMGQSITVKVWM